MVFKTLSADLFNLSRNYKTINVLSNEQYGQLQLITNGLNDFKDTGNLTTQTLKNIYKVTDTIGNGNLTNYFKSVAEGAENARVNIVDAYAAILDGNTRGLKNVQSIFNTYNQAFKNNEQGQKDFTKAVGQSNTALGNYLATIKKDGTASLTKYIGYLTKTTAKTIGLQVVTSSLSIGFSTLVSSAVTFGIGALSKAIDGLITTEKEAAEKAAELKQKNEKAVQASKEELNTINDLISQYEKFKDVTVRTSEDKETLKSIQDQLIETFGSESDGIDLVNGKYDEQIQKLKDLSEEKIKNNKINAQQVFNDVRADSTNNKSQAFISGAYYNDDGDLFGLNAFRQSNGVIVQNTKLINALKNIEGVLYSEEDNGSIEIDNMLRDVNGNVKRAKTSKELADTYEKIIDVLTYYSTSNFDFTQTDLFKDIVQQYNHYYDEAQATYNAAQNVVENEFKSYQLKHGSYEGLGREAYAQWINGFKNSFDGNDIEMMQVVDDFIEQINAEVGNYISSKNTNSVNEFKDFVEHLKNTEEISGYLEKFSDITSEIEDYDSIFEQQSKDGKLSSSNIKKIIEDGYEQLLVFDDKIQGYKLSESEFKTANQESINQSIQELKNLKQDLESNYAEVKKQLERDKQGISSESEFKQHENKFKETESLYNSANSQISRYISMLETANTETSEFTESIEAENEALEKATENIENINNAKSAVEKAIEEQNEFGRLSADSIKALHEAGLGAALAFNEATGETTLMTDSVYDLIDAMIEAEKNAAEIRLNNLKNDLAEINQELNNMTINGNFDKEKFIEGNQAKQEKEKQVAQEEMNLQILGSESYDFTSVEDSEQAVEDAHEEYINSIKEAFEREKSDIDYYLDMDLISQEEYYNRLAQLNEKYFKGKEDFLDEYRQYEVEVYQGLKKIREEQEEQFEEEKEEQINLIKEAFDKEKSDLDHLLAMEAITQEDYYNKLYDLNKQYFKDKEDFLDEYRQYEEEIYKGLRDVQIQAIQEQIDALKSVNEEKQEEIDLEKAKQALENAKKQRTIRVYDSERGWIHETDREAIDTAQKEYDDLVLNERIEVLENLIKSIEEGRNTKHSLDEKVDVLTQVSGSADITEIFPNLPDEFKQTLKNMQNSIASGIGASEMFAQQNYNSIPNNSNYEVNNKLSLQLNNVTVMANSPEEFISQMEQIADQSFNNNFPVAMGKFGEGLARYRMNHS